MATVLEMPESAVEKEGREVASYHAWFVFLGASALLAVNYYFRIDWLVGLSVVVAVVATWRTFAEPRTALSALGGLGLVLLGVYTHRQGIGVVMPFVLIALGTRTWAQGLCEAFSKGFVPPLDPRLQ